MGNLHHDISAPDRAGPKPIQCSRAAHLAPYLAFLEEVGAPVDRELRRARLPTLVTEDPNLYLADERARAFLRAIADREGIDDLPVRAVSHSDLWNLSATVGDAIAWSPTLYLALKQFCRYSAVEDSALNAWITEDETTIRVSCLNRTPLDPFSGRIEDWSQMAVVIAIIRSFVGSEWQPAEIALHSELPISELAAQLFPNTRLLRGQQSGSVSVPRGLLSRSVGTSGGGTLPVLTTRRDGGALEGSLDLISTMRSVLIPYLPNGLPSIDEAAEMAQRSPRTLQRDLQRAGATYSQVLQNVRYEHAARLLRESNDPIIHVALQVGIEDPSHFSRGFRQGFGVTPKEYRGHQRSVDSGTSGAARSD